VGVDRTVVDEFEPQIHYTASTLVFASALFFTAISERFEYRRARIALLGFAVVGLIGGLALALTQPTTLG
jgi:hypothetical protein